MHKEPVDCRHHPIWHCDCGFAALNFRIKESDQIIVVDARGLLCPEPLVRTRLALRASIAGAIIEIQATDPLATLDIEALCARGAAVYLGSSCDADGLHTIRIVKP